MQTSRRFSTSIGRGRFAALAAGLLALTGCATGSSFVQPDSAVAGSYYTDNGVYAAPGAYYGYYGATPYAPWSFGLGYYGGYPWYGGYFGSYGYPFGFGLGYTGVWGAPGYWGSGYGPRHPASGCDRPACARRVYRDHADHPRHGGAVAGTWREPSLHSPLSGRGVPGIDAQAFTASPFAGRQPLRSSGFAPRAIRGEAPWSPATRPVQRPVEFRNGPIGATQPGIGAPAPFRPAFRSMPQPRFAPAPRAAFAPTPRFSAPAPVRFNAPAPRRR